LEYLLEPLIVWHTGLNERSNWNRRNHDNERQE